MSGRWLVMDKMIFRTTAYASIAALLFLILIESFFTFLTELEDLGRGYYGLNQILSYVLWNTPARIYRIFPMALLLGGLLGLGQLTASNELTILRASGVSKLRLMAGALVAAILLSIASLSIGEWLAPKTQTHAEKQRAAALSENLSIRQGRGFWALSGDQIVHVQAMMPDASLGDITLFEMGENNTLSRYLYAPTARLTNKQWQVENGILTTLNTDHISQTPFTELAIPADLGPEILGALSESPETLPLVQLGSFIHYLESKGLDANIYRLSFWNKLLGPFTNISMLLLGLPLIFGKPRASGHGQRLLLGIFMGLGLYLANRMLGQIAILYGYVPILGAILPSLIGISVGAWTLLAKKT